MRPGGEPEQGGLGESGGGGRQAACPPSLTVGERRLTLKSQQARHLVKSPDVMGLVGCAKVRELFPEAMRGLGGWSWPGRWWVRAITQLGIIVSMVKEPLCRTSFLPCIVSREMAWNYFSHFGFLPLESPFHSELLMAFRTKRSRSPQPRGTMSSQPPSQPTCPASCVSCACRKHSPDGPVSRLLLGPFPASVSAVPSPSLPIQSFHPSGPLKIIILFSSSYNSACQL